MDYDGTQRMEGETFIPNKNYESICCGAVSSNELCENKTGRCSKCKDNSVFVPVSIKRKPCTSECSECSSLRC